MAYLHNFDNFESTGGLSQVYIKVQLLSSILSEQEEDINSLQYSRETTGFKGAKFYTVLLALFQATYSS